MLELLQRNIIPEYALQKCNNFIRRMFDILKRFFQIFQQFQGNMTKNKNLTYLNFYHINHNWRKSLESCLKLKHVMNIYHNLRSCWMNFLSFLSASKER